MSRGPGSGRRELDQDLAGFCASLGFVDSGVASLEPSRRADALTAWLEAGYGGTMRYLHRRAAKRKRPGDIVPGARAAVVVLDNYFQGVREPGSQGVRVAQYARGGDYHRVLYQRLERIAEWLIDRGATVAHPWTDNGPVPERELAERAGLGWIGKNSMLIRPQSGSFHLIGSVFTDLALAADSIEAAGQCGGCTRCLAAIRGGRRAANSRKGRAAECNGEDGCADCECARARRAVRQVGNG